jgi:hypothetical protein
MFYERRSSLCPFFSVCIPQYNRTPFFLQLLRSLVEQRFKDFEVCISDGFSPEGRHREIIDFLNSSEMPYAYSVQPRTTPYDGNLRAAIGLAKGRYCLLMGNDDALANTGSLENLAAEMAKRGPADVVITDYEDYATGKRARRIRQTCNYGSGPKVAVRHFRNFSFVSGVLLGREKAQNFATDRWDGSEMYQTYIGCRMIASGSPLLELDWVLVRKDISIPDQNVDSYAAKPRLKPCPIIERRLPLSLLGRVVTDAIEPHAPRSIRQSLALRTLLQLMIFTYPFWIIEYRRVQSWRYALGVCLGMRPQIISEGIELARARQMILFSLYTIVTATGLLLPIRLFQLGQRHLYRLAKRFA